MNVYAPTLRGEREAFFASLLRWDLASSNTIMAGDFNCVQSPLLDRFGCHRSHRSESPALDKVVETLSLTDARVLREHAEDDGFEIQLIILRTGTGTMLVASIDSMFPWDGLTVFCGWKRGCRQIIRIIRRLYYICGTISRLAQLAEIVGWHTRSLHRIRAESLTNSSQKWMVWL